MLKKTISVCLALIMALSLTACGNANAPTAPTTEPDNVCDANGHTWVAATCLAPKTCSVCGETEGEPLEHTWVDANYQQPKTCSVCKVTVGEPLVTYFTESGLEEKLLAPAGEYSYSLVCAMDESKRTVANVIVEDYQTIVSDDTHEAMDGYEWKILSLKLHFADENAPRYSFYPGHYLWTDKFEAHISTEEDNEEDLKEDDDVIYDLFTTGIPQSFQWNGVEYTDGWLHIEENLTEWKQDEGGNYYIDFYITISVRVPVGYDGFVFGLDAHDWEWTDGKYLHEVVTDNTLLFRMD